MKRGLEHENSVIKFEENQPSCMWELPHFFDNHYWQNFKKLLPHKKHGHEKHLKSIHGTKSSEKEDEIEEVLEFLRAECDSIVDQTSSKKISINKPSGIARIKELINIEMFKEKHHKPRAFHYPLGSKLQRTYSIHHFEPKHPIILLQKIGNSSFENKVSKKTTDRMDRASETSKDPFDENIDVLDIFKVNKNVFEEIVRDSSIANSKRKSIFFSRDELEKTEIWPHPKGDSLQKSTSLSKRDIYTKSMSLRADTSALEQLKRSTSSPYSSDGSNYPKKRRSHSKSKSVDNYTKLFEHSSIKDTKFSLSKSLKLTNEERHSSKNLRRVLSLSDIESHSAFQTVKYDLKSELIEVVNDDENDVLNKLNENMVEVTLEEANSHLEMDTSMLIAGNAIQNQIIQESQNIVCNAESQIPEDSDLDSNSKPITMHLDELNDQNTLLNLSPLLLEEFRTTIFEDIYDDFDHNLLLDLINEALLQICETSYTYWPKTLSHICHIHRIQTGNYFLEDISKIINGYLSIMRLEDDPSLDYTVGQDFAKDDWMNLQIDTECVSLEVEEMIFEDLLDEILGF